MIAIHYPTAYRALDNYVDRFNSQTSQSSHKLKTATVAAAKEIIRIYGVSLLKKNNQRANPEQLPPLFTNNKQLATLVKCSSRSIQRYMIRLRQASIVTGKVHHGPNANYELWINPEILWANSGFQPETNNVLLKQPGLKNVLTHVNTPVFGPQRTDRLPSYSGNFKNNIQNEVDNVDFLEIDDSGNISGNTRKIAERSDVPGNKSSAAAAGDYPGNEDENKLISPLVDEFWTAAKKQLYPCTTIIPRQEATARKLIRELYCQKSNRDLQEVHAAFLQRISLAAEYVQKDPIKRFIPLPYIYFDSTNAKGFTGTEEWYWQSGRYKDNMRKEILLERLIKRYRNNDKAPLSQRLPVLKLYKACEQRLAVYGDEELINKFYTAVIDFHASQKACVA